MTTITTVKARRCPNKSCGRWLIRDLLDNGKLWYCWECRKEYTDEEVQS